MSGKTKWGNTVLSVTVLQIAVDKGTVMSDCLDKAETLVEQRDTADKLEQSKVYLWCENAT